MRAWHLMIVVNLAALIGVGAGYLYWGRQVQQLAVELKQARATPPRAEREWKEVVGVVRGIMPDVDVVVLSHADLVDYMRPMTMGFKAASPKVYEGLKVGDTVQFTLRGIPPRVRITAIEKTEP